MTRHVISTAAWAVAFVFAAGFYAGAVFGIVTSPAAHDSRVIEKRLREVFCEQIVLNKLMTTCKVD